MLPHSPEWSLPRSNPEIPYAHAPQQTVGLFSIGFFSIGVFSLGHVAIGMWAYGVISRWIKAGGERFGL